VCKLISADGRSAVKLSDNESEAIGTPSEIERHRRVFGTAGDCECSGGAVRTGNTMLADRELLISIYANFNARKIDAVLVTMHPDVDWPNGMEGGRLHGHKGVREYWTRQWGMIDPHVEPVGFRADGPGKTTVTVHQVVRGLEGNLLVDQMVEHTYLIEDGLIRRIDIGDQSS